MKTILKNLWLTLVRFKLATMLNIMGLAIALTVLIIVSSILFWEFRFNHNYDHAARIYHMYVETNDGQQSVHSRALVDHIGENTAGIDKYCLFSFNSHLSNPTWRIANTNTHISSNVVAVSPTFVDIFSPKCIDGDMDKFSLPNSVIISESASKRYWSDRSAIGEIITLNDTVEYIIVAVYKDFPSNCSTSFSEIYTNLGDENIGNWNVNAYMGYYMLKENTNINQAMEQMHSSTMMIWNSISRTTDKNIENELKLIPLKNIYYSLDSHSGNRLISYLMLAVGIIVIFIAIVNYFNFFMAMIPIRIKAINIGKIFGASRLSLCLNMIFEATLIIIIAFILALLLTNITSSLLRTLMLDSVATSTNLSILFMVLLFATLLGVIVILFASIYMTRQAPAFVLRGSFGLSKKGKSLRYILTGIQFISAICLIIGGLSIVLQNNYLKTFDYGFDRDRIVTVKASSTVLNNIQTLEVELETSPVIENFAYSSPYLEGSNMTMNLPFENESIPIDFFIVSYKFPEFMKFKFIDGRSFTAEDISKTTSPVVLINQTAADKMNLKAGDIIQSLNAQVIGILEDFNFSSLHSTIKPVIIIGKNTLSEIPMGILSIRIHRQAKFNEVEKIVSSALSKVDPNIDKSSISVIPLDQNIEKLYSKEQYTAILILIFAIAAIIIALLGVLGIVIFEMQHYSKEIAIRKVFGSSVYGILLKFNLQIVKVLIISSFIAFPLSWFAIDKWLSSYPYRVFIPWWIFPLGALTVFIVVIFIVTMQTYKVANENPTKKINSN